MQAPYPHCLIGVDGGGTSCRVALIVDGRRFGVTLGTANVMTDRAGAIAQVCRGISQVVAQADLSAESRNCVRVHVALAGAKSRTDESEVAQGVVEGTGLTHVQVSEDQISSLCGALGEMDGFVAAIGTGSFLARQQGGQHRFIGGWGLDLGDEASGAWLGRGLLAATLRVQDGIGETSPICEEMMGRFGDAAGIVAFTVDARPAEVAELAPLIVERAQVGDVVAAALMRSGAVYIERGLTALGYEAGNVVSLTGGLRHAYGGWLNQTIRGDLRERLGDPLEGALFLAAQAEGAG